MQQSLIIYLDSQSIHSFLSIHFLSICFLFTVEQRSACCLCFVFPHLSFYYLNHCHYHCYLLCLQYSNCHLMSFHQKNHRQNQNPFHFDPQLPNFICTTLNSSFIISKYHSIFLFHSFVEFITRAINWISTIIEFAPVTMRLETVFQLTDFSFPLFLL